MMLCRVQHRVRFAAVVPPAGVAKTILGLQREARQENSSFMLLVTFTSTQYTQ